MSNLTPKVYQVCDCNTIYIRSIIYREQYWQAGDDTYRTTSSWDMNVVAELGNLMAIATKLTRHMKNISGVRRS